MKTLVQSLSLILTHFLLFSLYKLIFWYTSGIWEMRAIHLSGSNGIDKLGRDLTATWGI